MSIKPPKFLFGLLLWSLYAALFFVGVRWLLPWLAPFIIAAVLAAMLEPIVRFLSSRCRIPRAAASGLCVFLLTFAVAMLLVWGAVSAAGELAELAGGLPEALGSLLNTLENLEERAAHYIVSAPAPVCEYLTAALDSLEEQLAAVPAAVSGRLPGLISSAVEKTPLVLLFAVTAGLGTYFVSASYPEIKAFIMRQIPEKRREGVHTLKRDLVQTLGGWLRAQGLLTLAVFGVLCVSFLLLGVDYPLLTAVLTAVVDALPVFGAGTVLLPWAVYCLLTGEFARSAGLALCYAAAAVLRSTLQAKLVGDRLGLHPVVSLFSIYLGFRVCGVAGMLLFPLTAVLLCRLNSRGVVHLWRD